MSVERIYGGWDTCTRPNQKLQPLWHKLAAQHNGTMMFQPNNGLSQRKNEIIELWKLFLELNPEIVVEVGVAQGGTFASWCALSQPGTTLIGIDKDVNDCRPRQGDQVHPEIAGPCDKLTTQGGGMMALGRPGQIIIPINGWTTAAETKSRLLNVLNGRKVDFLFHDASHDSDGFNEDFEFFWPLIGEGGVMAVHDIQPSSHPDVTKSRVWDRIKQYGDYSALYEYRGARTSDSLGIGVLIK